MSQLTELSTLYIAGYAITLIYLAVIMSDRTPTGMIRSVSVWMTLLWFVKAALTAFYVDKLQPMQECFLVQITIAGISFSVAAAMVFMAKEIYSSCGLFLPLGFFYGFAQIIATHIWDRTISTKVFHQPYSMTYFCLALWLFGFYITYRLLEEYVQNDEIRHFLQIIVAAVFICLAIAGIKAVY